MRRSERPQDEDTRGRLLALLCGGSATIRDLVDEIGITANGIRGQLQRLEAEGLVTHQVVRRGVGKPAHEYHLTTEGSLQLSRAYLPLLSGLLGAVEKQRGAGQAEDLLREAGRMLGRQRPRPQGALRERANAAATLLEELGAHCMLREEEEVLWIEGACCPLRALVPEHPLACKAVAAMLEEYTGAPVSEECDKHDPPTCRLMVGAGR